PRRARGGVRARLARLARLGARARRGRRDRALPGPAVDRRALLARHELEAHQAARAHAPAHGVLGRDAGAVALHERGHEEIELLLGELDLRAGRAAPAVLDRRVAAEQLDGDRAVVERVLIAARRVDEHLGDPPGLAGFV